MTAHPDYVLVRADVLASLNQSEEPRVNIGDATTGVGVQAGAPIWGQGGFISVPDEPSADGACEVIYWPDGDQKHVIATRDRRMVAKIGNLASTPSTRAIVNKSEGRFIINGSGAVTLSTHVGNTPDGAPLQSRLDPNDGSWSVHTPHGFIVIDETGIYAAHKSGASIILGGSSDPAAPNYVMINAAKVLIDSPRTNIGPTPSGGGEGVFLAPVLAPVASAATGVPTPIGAGMGVVLGVTSTSVFFGA